MIEGAIVGLALIVAFAAGYLLRDRTCERTESENAQLRSFLYTSRGYAITTPSGKKESTDGEPDAAVEPSKSLHMKMPDMGAVPHKAPDLFAEKRRAMAEDTQLVNEGKKQASL